MEIMCPLCGSKRHSIDGTNKHYMVLKCTECDLIFSVPMVSNIDYSSEKTHSRSELNIVEQLVRDILGSKKQKVKILEIGCGDLRHLIKLKLKFKNNIELYGYDLHLSEYTELKAKQYNIKLLSDLKQISYCFDIVYLFHVLEHVEDPLNFIDRLRNFICQNGFLVLSVPNPKRITRFLFPEEWDKPGYHLTRWNKKSLMYLALYSDLEILRISCTNFNILDFYILPINIKEVFNKVIIILNRILTKIIKVKLKIVDNSKKVKQAYEDIRFINIKEYTKITIEKFIIEPISIGFALLIFPVFVLLGKGKGLSLILVCKKRENKGV